MIALVHLLGSVCNELFEFTNTAGLLTILTNVIADIDIDTFC